MAKPVVGLIGVGEMGLPMGINLISAGFPLVAYDVRPEANDGIRSKGAKVASSPADLARSSDIIISILPNSKIVKQVLLEGKDNVVSALQKKHTVIEMSTLDVETTLDIEKRVKEKGAGFVDAPISGVPDKVVSRDIIILASGDKAAVDNSMDVLNALGKMVEYVGEAGKGKIVKLINNYLVATHKIATTEAVCYAMKNGIDVNQLLKIIGVASGKSDAFMRYTPVIVNGDKAISNKHSWHSKDLKLINEECNRLGIPLILGSLSYQITQASTNEYQAESFGSLVSFYKKLMKI